MIFLLLSNVLNSSIFYVPGDGDGDGLGEGEGEGEGEGLGLGEGVGVGVGNTIPSTDFPKGEVKTTSIWASVDEHSPMVGQFTPVPLKTIGSAAALEISCCWVWTSLIPKGMATIIMAKTK